MKKLKFIVLLCTILMFGVQSVHAQWFQDREIKWFSNGVNSYEPDKGVNPGGGGQEGEDPDPNDPNSPIGSGVAILFGFGVGYACVKRSRNED